MNDTGSLVRHIAMLGQSVSREKRSELFAMLSAWLIVIDSKCQIDLNAYFRALPSDTRKDLYMVQQSLTMLNLSEALSFLHHATSITNAIETLLEEQSRFENRVEYITTQPAICANAKELVRPHPCGVAR